MKKQQPIYGQSNSWSHYTENGVVVQIGYSHLKLTKTPLIFTSLHAVSHIWTTTGATSIYGATKDGFSVYISGLNKDQMFEHKAVLHYQLILQ